jgi:hypothetical protein
MGAIDDFLNGGADEFDALAGTVSMTCDGQTFAVVVNGSRKSYEGALGGLESDIQAIATAQPSDVTDPKSLMQKRCTVGGVPYRIVEVDAGTVAVHFTLADVNNSK